MARRHANTLPTKTSQIRMALRHHEHNFGPHTRSNHITLEAKKLLSPAPQRCFPRYICTTNWPLLSPAPKSSFPFYMCTTNWPGLSPAPKSSFPYYICTTTWPLLSPAPKSSFPHYMRTTKWPGLSPAPQVKRQVSKINVSYETSSKSEALSLQNERFVRDFLQK